MKAKRFSEEQIIGVLREAEAGVIRSESGLPGEFQTASRVFLGTHGAEHNLQCERTANRSHCDDQRVRRRSCSTKSRFPQPPLTIPWIR